MGQAADPQHTPRGTEREQPVGTDTGRGPARTVLALLLLAMAAGQAGDPAAFARILDTYRMFPGGSETVAAGLLLAGEVVAGVALLRASRYGGALALTVALAWTVLGVQAFARSLRLDNCGCFGVHLAQPLRWWVLVQDAYFVGLAAWVVRADRRKNTALTAAEDRR